MISWLDSLPKLRPSARRILAGAALAALLGIYAVEATTAARDLSATWDEPVHILAGYRYWQAGDYGINPEHPPLAKLIGTFPLLFMHLKVPAIGPDDTKPTVVVAGRQLVYGNDADALLLRARLAEAFVGILFILMIFEAGFRMFGAGVAWIAAVLAVFEPNLIAHSTLVTTDFALAFFCLATVYSLWRLAEQPGHWRLAQCGAMLGLALASKHSAILLPPILALLAVVEIVYEVTGVDPEDASKRYRTMWAQIRAWAMRLAIIYGISLLILWAFYGFRYEARPDGMALWQSVEVYAQELPAGLQSSFVTSAAQFRLLPESYLFGLTDVLLVTQGPRVSFLFGHLYPHALWYYFPVNFLIKSTLGFLILLALALAFVKRWSGECHRRAAYLLIPPIFFLGIALTSGSNMGVRHILPIFPFLILAAAAGAWELLRRNVAWAVAIAALLAFHLASSVRTFPDYLAYSNELFGGTSRTYLRLSDSNVDWGQGMKETERYLAQHHIKECWLAYFGSADPAYYHLPCKLLPDPFLRWWGEPIEVPPEKYHGIVLISGTEVAAPYWGPDALNPYATFLTRRPTDNIGGSVLVYEGDIDLRQASGVGHMYKAWDYIAAKDSEAAIHEALAAGEIMPDHPGPPFIIGYILAQQKRTEAARLQFQESLRLAEAASPEYQQKWVNAAKAQLAILP